jgi:hypothetical protein
MPVISFYLFVAFFFQDLYHELHALDRFEQEYCSRINGKGHTDRIEKGWFPICNTVFHFGGGGGGGGFMSFGICLLRKKWYCGLPII